MTATRIRVLLPCPPRTAERAWGDYYFGHSLGDALEQQGYQVCYSYAPQTRRERLASLIERLKNRDEIELIIRGKREWSPLPGKRSLIWVISQSASIRPRELGRYDHVFCASPKFLEQIASACRSSSLLYQCTDATRFVPQSEQAGEQVVFVGNRRKYAPRDIVLRLIEQGIALAVWGRGWEDALPAARYRGLHIENTELPKTYGTAGAVLNDHTSDMLADGFVSNRVYDVLASGVPVVTERMDGIPEDLLPYVYLYDPGTVPVEELTQAVADSLSDRSKFTQFAKHVGQVHSFAARAHAIAGVIQKLTGSVQDLHVPETQPGG